MNELVEKTHRFCVFWWREAHEVKDVLYNKGDGALQTAVAFPQLSLFSLCLHSQILQIQQLNLQLRRLFSIRLTSTHCWILWKCGIVKALALLVAFLNLCYSKKYKALFKFDLLHIIFALKIVYMRLYFVLYFVLSLSFEYIEDIYIFFCLKQCYGGGQIVLKLFAYNCVSI